MCRCIHESCWNFSGNISFIMFIITGVLIFAISSALCSRLCRYLHPREISMEDLEGQWYWVLATFNEYDCEEDCSGFFGIAHNSTHGTLMVTDRLDYNPVMEAVIKHRRVVIEGKDPVCCRTTYFAYQAALISDNILCFYFCGVKSEVDYAQCFSRSQDITSFDHQKIDFGLRYFGLVLGDNALRKVNREFCSNRSPGQPTLDIME